MPGDSVGIEFINTCSVLETNRLAVEAFHNLDPNLLINIDGVRFCVSSGLPQLSHASDVRERFLSTTYRFIIDATNWGGDAGTKLLNFCRETFGIQSANCNGVNTSLVLETPLENPGLNITIIDGEGLNYSIPVEKYIEMFIQYANEHAELLPPDVANVINFVTGIGTLGVIIYIMYHWKINPLQVIGRFIPRK